MAASPPRSRGGSRTERGDGPSTGSCTPQRHQLRTSPGVADASTRYVALLRGINVGRAKPVGMAELKATVEALGFDDVRTLLRSGNVVFAGKAAASPTVAARLEAAIEERFAMKVGVVVRTADELAAAVAANPIPE